MKRSVTRALALLLALLVLCSMTAFAADETTAAPIEGAPAVENLSYEKFLELLELYEETYYIKKDRETILLEAFEHLLEQYPELFPVLTNGVLSAGDPYSVYLSPEQSDQFENYKIFGGVGITIKPREDGLIVVEEINPDCAAEAAGIKVGDQVVAIDGKTVNGLSLEAVGTLARGEIGTPVTYTIFRPETGRMQDFAMVRERVSTVTVTYTFPVIDRPDGSKEVYAVCDIRDFSGMLTYFEFIEFLKVAQDMGVTRYIFDVRDNPGGDLDVSLEIINRMMAEKDKLIVKAIPREEADAVSFHSTGSGVTSDQVIILVNEHSASAAELFAISLQENGIATVVGQKTFGKAIGQQVFELNDGSSAHITVMQLESPKGNRYHGKGVLPDVALENSLIPRPLPAFLPFNHDNYLQAAPGAVNPVVEALEQRLLVVGIMSKADATYDEATTEALKLYQNLVGLPATGLLDRATLESITHTVNQVKQIKYYHDDQMDKAVELVTKAVTAAKAS